VGMRAGMARAIVVAVKLCVIDALDESQARLRPMRGLKRDRTARVIVGRHAFVQNLRRGFYDLGIDVRPTARLADAFAELALVI